MSREHVGCGFDHASVHDGRRRLYVAHTANERGAPVIAFDATGNTVYAFRPRTRRAAVYLNEPG